MSDPLPSAPRPSEAPAPGSPQAAARQDRPPGLLARMRRPAVLAWLVTAVVVLLLIGGTIQYSRHFRAERDRETTRLDSWRRERYALELNLAAALWDHDPGQGLQILRDQQRCPLLLRDFTWRLDRRLCRRQRLSLPTAFQVAAVSPDGHTLATINNPDAFEGPAEGDPQGEPSGFIRLWDASSGNQRSVGDTGQAGLRSLAFSPDGKLLASGGLDGTIKLWDTGSNELRTTLKGHRGSVNSLAFSPDGKLLASGGGQLPGDPQGRQHVAELKLWDVAAGRERADLKEHQGEVHVVAFSPDGATLASASGSLDWPPDTRVPPRSPTLIDCSVRLWNLRGPEPRLRAVLTHAAPVLNIAFHPDGKTLATANNRDVRLWDTDPTSPAYGKERTSWQQAQEVCALAIAPDGGTLATAEAEGLVQLQDLSAHREQLVLRVPGGYGAALAFFPDGKTLATVTQEVTLWDLAVRPERATLTGHQGPVAAVAFDPDSGHLASAGAGDRTVNVWDTATGRLSTTLQIDTKADDAPTTSLRCLAFAPEGQRLAVGGGQVLAGKRTPFVQLWDVSKRQALPLPVTSLPDSSPFAAFESLSFSADGMLLAAACGDNVLRLWNVDTGQEHATLQVYPPEGSAAGQTHGWIRAVAFAPEDNLLAFGGQERYGDQVAAAVKLWDVSTGKEQATLTYSRAEAGQLIPLDVHCLAFTSDGRTLAAAGLAVQEGRQVPIVTLWDVKGHHIRATLRPRGTVRQLAFSPDDLTLAVALDEPGQAAVVHLWDPVTGVERAGLPGHGGSITSVAFAEDGRFLASASNDGTVKLWDAGAEGLSLDDVTVPEEDRDSGQPEPRSRIPVFSWTRLHDLHFTSWLFLLLAVVPVCYVSAFCHELGHVLMARWNGYLVTSFGMGMGRLFWVGRWRGSRVYLGLKRPSQGITFTLAAQIYPSRRQAVAMLAGGVLAHLLLATLSGLLCWWLPWGRLLWGLVCFLNLLLAFINLLPFRARVGNFTLRSDGALILGVLRGGVLPAGSPAERLERAAALRALWQEAGDHLHLYFRQLGSALSWCELGDTDRAERLLTEAEALPLEHTPFTRAYAAVVRGIVLRGIGKLPESERELEAGEQGFHALHHEAGLFLVRWARAELRHQQGAVAEASATLDTLANHPLLPPRPVLQQALLESRLVAHAAQANLEQVESLRTDYEARRKRFPSSACDLRIYRTLGQMWAGRQEWERAEPAYRAALEAARKLCAGLGEEQERARFVECQTPLLAAAADCLRHTGKEEEAATLHDTFAALVKRQPPPAVVKPRSSRIGLRVSWALTLLNLCCAIALILLVAFLDARSPGGRILHLPDGDTVVLNRGKSLRAFVGFFPLVTDVRLGQPWGLVLIVLVLSVVAILLFAVVRFLVGRVFPSLRQRGGSLAVGVALSPWFVLVFWLINRR